MLDVTDVALLEKPHLPQAYICAHPITPLVPTPFHMQVCFHIYHISASYSLSYQHAKGKESYNNAVKHPRIPGGWEASSC